jgi:hypothetical protein
MLSGLRSSLAPPLTSRGPLPPAHGPAYSGTGDWCRRPDLRGAGGNANAIRRARAELSSPEHAHQAGKRSSPPDRSGRGADGARRGGLGGHADRQLRPAAGRRATHRASWRAAERKATAMHTVVSMRVMGQGQMRHREGARKHAPRGGNAQMNPEDGLGQQTPIDRPAAPRQLSHLAAQKICAVRTCARWKGSVSHRNFFLTFSFEDGMLSG